jgi:hypothetical protein
MGFSISWIAFKGLGKTEVLRRSGLRDAGCKEETPAPSFCLAELPAGWVILFANCFDYVTPRRLTLLSAAATVLACKIEEHVMFSAAAGYLDGQEVWSVWHDAQRSIYNLETEGALPPELQPIRQRLTGRQDKEGGRNAGVDHIFDIPVELAAALTGYRHDHTHFDWGQPRFVNLETAG